MIGRRSIEERALALGDRSPAERIEEAHATLLELVELCEQPKLRLPDTKEVTLNDLPPLAKSLPGEVLAYAALTVRLAVMTADAAVKQTMVAEQKPVAETPRRSAETRIARLPPRTPRGYRSVHRLLNGPTNISDRDRSPDGIDKLELREHAPGAERQQTRHHAISFS